MSKWIKIQTKVTTDWLVEVEDDQSIETAYDIIDDYIDGEFDSIEGYEVTPKQLQAHKDFVPDSQTFTVASGKL